LLVVEALITCTVHAKPLCSGYLKIRRKTQGNTITRISKENEGKTSSTIFAVSGPGAWIAPDILRI